MRRRFTLLGIASCTVFAAACSADEPNQKVADATELMAFQEEYTTFWSIAFSLDGKFLAGDYTRLPDSFIDQGKGISPAGVQVFEIGTTPLQIKKIEIGVVDRCTVVATDERNALQTARSEPRYVRISPRTQEEDTATPTKIIRYSILNASNDDVDEASYTITTPYTGFWGPIALSWKAKLLATGGAAPRSKELGDIHGEVCLWDLETGEQRFRQYWESGGYFSIAFSPDGELLAVGGGHDAFVLRNGQRIVGGGDKFRGRLRIWNTRTGDEVLARDFDDHRIDTLAFSPDGRFLVTGGNDGAVKKWKLEDGTIEAEIVMDYPPRDRKEVFGRPRALCVAYSPDGRFVSIGVGSWNRGGKWGELRIWDLQNPERTLTLLRKHPHVITCTAFSFDSKMLAAGTADDHLRVWNIEGLTK